MFYSAIIQKSRF